jgi:uncharacterized protein YjbI with pentapeptide repeats
MASYALIHLRPEWPDGPMDAQFGPHRFSAADGGGSSSTEFRAARFDVADLRGARFTDCDLTAETQVASARHLGRFGQCPSCSGCILAMPRRS